MTTSTESVAAMITPIGSFFPDESDAGERSMREIGIGVRFLFIAPLFQEPDWLVGDIPFTGAGVSIFGFAVAATLGG